MPGIGQQDGSALMESSETLRSLDRNVLILHPIVNKFPLLIHHQTLHTIWLDLLARRIDGCLAFGFGDCPRPLLRVIHLQNPAVNVLTSIRAKLTNNESGFDYNSKKSCVGIELRRAVLRDSPLSRLPLPSLGCTVDSPEGNSNAVESWLA